MVINMFGPYILLIVFGVLFIPTIGLLAILISKKQKVTLEENKVKMHKYHCLVNFAISCLIGLVVCFILTALYSIFMPLFIKGRVEGYNERYSTITAAQENISSDYEMIKDATNYNNWLKSAKEDKLKNNIWSMYYFQDLESMNYIDL